MNFLKSLFKDDDKVIGLCSLKRKTQKSHVFIPNYGGAKKTYGTNYRKNIFVWKVYPKVYNLSPKSPATLLSGLVGSPRTAWFPLVP